jgi:Domain of unknown function (DUF5666)
MKFRLVSSIALALLLGAAAWAQDNSAPPQGQNPPMRYGPGAGRMGMGAMVGRGVTGTVTGAAAGRFTVKTFRGETYAIDYSANTRFMKEPPRAAGGRQAGGYGMRRNPPQPIKAGDIKAGDAIMAMGQVDASAKSVEAARVVLLDPERVQRMEQMEASYGKTWLMGKVTAIDGVKVTLQGSLDNQPYSFVADENTDFRDRRQPVALADIKPGAMVRVEGAVKDGVFTATTVNVMPAFGGMGRRPGNTPPPQ